MPSEIDLYEINESFAVQAILTARMLNLDMNKVNVNGGNLALGYPIGTTGLRMNVTLIHEMIRRNSRLGISAMCAGGNMADIIVYENVMEV
jgi:acetyl-CoA C-acetyltransferase